MMRIYSSMPDTKRVHKILEKRECVILFLYLLHHVDYPYSIAKAFENNITERERQGKKSYPLKITNASKVANALKKMREANIVEFHTKKVNGLERKYYSISIRAFKPLMGQTSIKDSPAKGWVKIIYNPDYVRTCLQLILANSPDENTCIKRILSIKEYDYLTMMAYFRSLLAEIEKASQDSKKALKKKADLNLDANLTSMSSLRDYILFVDQELMEFLYRDRGLDLVDLFS